MENSGFIMSNYGTNGLETVKIMDDLAKKNNFNLIFSDQSKQWTVLGSSNLSREEIRVIFHNCAYQGWKPSITGEVDSNGNYLLQLKYFYATRQEYAQVRVEELMLEMEDLEINSPQGGKILSEIMALNFEIFS